MVQMNGATTDFTGVGTPNPKLNITQKTGMDQSGYRSMLQIEQWANNLQQAGAFGNITHTYAVSGTISVPSGATGYLPPFFMNEVCTMYGVMTLLRAGSATITLEQNGTAFATGIAVGTTPAFTNTNQSVAVNDYFQPVVTAVTGADGLSVSFYFDI